MNLTGRDFLKLLDFSAEEIIYMLDLAADLKKKKKKGKHRKSCQEVKESEKRKCIGWGSNPRVFQQSFLRRPP